MASGGGGGSSGHRQLWLCEMCEQQPAAFTCKADAAALCYACDAGIHSTNPLASKHQRFPVSPFLNQLYSSTTTTTNRNNAAPSLLFKASDVDDDDDEEAKGDGEVLADGRPLWLLPSNHNPKPRNLFFDVEQHLDLDYAASMNLGLHPEIDSVVPVKNRYAPARPPPAPVVTESFKPYVVHLSEAVAAGSESLSTRVGAVVAVGVDREARVMRYREKRKIRRFGKTIRYASRKAYAESRRRVKGRFVKREESNGVLKYEHLIQN